MRALRRRPLVLGLILLALVAAPFFFLSLQNSPKYDTDIFDIPITKSNVAVDEEENAGQKSSSSAFEPLEEELVPLRQGSVPSRGLELRKRLAVDFSSVTPWRICRNHSDTSRNYYKQPVILSQHIHSFWKPDKLANNLSAFSSLDFNEPESCDIPCAISEDAEWRVSADGFVIDVAKERVVEAEKRCGYQYIIFFGMESDVDYPPLGIDRYEHSIGKHYYDILASYDLRSDVPLPYFLWSIKNDMWGYNLLRKPIEKKKDRDVFAALSNCNNIENLRILTELIENGIRVDSYGVCMNNKNFSVPLPRTLNGGYDVAKQKIDQSAPYPFVVAFENSRTPYYVTEKLIEALVVGAIPIYLGVDSANLKHFSPSRKAVINVADFANARVLAKRLKYLLKNETAYNTYLDWKTKGTTKEFRSTMDISRVHSSCRLCIRIADMNRWRFGWSHEMEEQNPFQTENKEANDKYLAAEKDGGGRKKQHRVFLVRERGFFWFRLIFLADPTIENFNALVVEKLGPFSEHYETKLVRKSALEPIKRIDKTEDLKKLPNFTELEVVLFYY